MLKIIAFLTMTIDHVGLVFFPQYFIFRIIGRLAFPLFAFGIAQGYVRTRNVYNYGQRILLLALISQPIFYLLINESGLNICFTLLFGLISIYIYDKFKNQWLKYGLILLLLISGQIMQMDYGAYGILMILLFFIFRDKPILIFVQSALVFLMILSDFNQLLNVFAIISFFIAYYLKDYDFKINRTVQYLFYPVHMLILYIILRLIT